MNIKVSIKYTEGYLPSSRHRKLRYRECASTEEISIKEIGINDTRLKYRVNGKEIREYGEHLYSKVVMSRNLFYCGENKRNGDNDTVLGRLKFSFVGYSTFYGFNPEDTKEKMLKQSQSAADKYLIIDGELWEKTGVPYYRLCTFGLGGNHAGIGTSLSVDYGDSRDRVGFKAEEREVALKKALEVATRRGDTDSIAYIKAIPLIEIFE